MQYKKYLYTIAALENSYISAPIMHKWTLLKEISTYQCLNKMKSGESLFMGLFWIPRSRIEMLTHKVDELRKTDQNIHGPQVMRLEGGAELNPPTRFMTNSFLAPFQQITDTYGVPSYKEANPTLFAIVTFPFLFGVMFGDVGHGGMLFIAACLLTLFPGTFTNLGLGDLVSARYMLVIMGMMATFCGLCYNDFMALPLELFESCYKNIDEHHVELKEDCVYPIGFDPKWYLGANELTYFNSVKMKIAVILGVA